MSNCDADCQCEKCCGGIKKVTLPKALIGYKTRCIEFCRPGEHNLQTVQVDQSWAGLLGTAVAAKETFNVRCSNSKIWGNHEFEVTFDLRCGDSVITRDMELIDRQASIPMNYTWVSVPMECDTHRATVELDALFEIEPGGVETTTILADLVDIIDLEFIDGSIPLAVASPELPVPTTMQVDVDITVEMFQQQ